MLPAAETTGAGLRPALTKQEDVGRLESGAREAQVEVTTWATVRAGAEKVPVYACRGPVNTC